MTLINCEACGTEISKESKSCTKCGHPTSKSLAKHKREERAAFAKANPPGPATWVFTSLIGIALLYSCIAPRDKTTATASTFNEYSAFEMCKSMLQVVSKYPDKSDIPRIRAVISDREFTFAWGASTEHMMWMNGFGAMVPTSAACIVNKDSKSISGLSVNGQTVL